MKFYGIDSEGRLRLPHISVLPTYDYTKHKRLVICQDLDDTIYVGTGDADGFWMALADSDEVAIDIDTAISTHDGDESAHSFILNKITEDIAIHDALATAHAPIRAEIDSDIATHDALSTAHPAIRAEIDSDIVTHNGDATAHPAIRTEIDSDIAIHNGDETAHNLHVLFAQYDELIQPSQQDREFSGEGVMHWANTGSLSVFDTVTDLTITSDGIGQYCYLAPAYAPMSVGQSYSLSFEVSDIVGSWLIKSGDGTQTFSIGDNVVDTNGVQQMVFTASGTTTGGFRIVAEDAGSSGSFDNFSLKSAEDWAPIINTRIGIHDEDPLAHELVRTATTAEIAAHNTDAGNDAHQTLRTKIGTDISSHNVSGTAHADIRSGVGTDIAAHNTSITAHADIRTEIDTDISTHDSDSTAHPAIRTEISTRIIDHDEDEDAHEFLIDKIDSDIGTHNLSSSAHNDIRSAATLHMNDLTAHGINNTISVHNTSSVAHESIRTNLSNHGHGNINKDGKIGVTSALPIITGALGLLQTGQFGEVAGSFCEGNDSRLNDARAPESHVLNSSLHTVSGLTSGHVLRASGATTYAFSAIQNSDLPNPLTSNTTGNAATVTNGVYTNTNQTITGIKTHSTDIVFNNYGVGIVGTYSATRYQGVFAMGNSYKLATDGLGVGSLYGIAWTHSNIGGQSKSGLGHQALFMTNGVTQTAIGTGIWTNGIITGNGSGITDLNLWNTTVTSVSKTLVYNEHCKVSVSGKTITLPSSVSAGMRVKISVLNFTDTVLNRNGHNIMGIASNMTIDLAYVTIELTYIDSTSGWIVS